MMIRRATLRVVTSTIVFAMSTAAARATVSSAERGLFWSTVTVTGKAANATYHIWQESGVGTGSYFDTGYTVSTGPGGAGSGDVPNVASGTLLPGRRVKIGSAASPNAQAPATVTRSFASWLLSSANPGPNNADIQLANFDNSGADTFRQSYDAGTSIALSMNTSYGQFLNMGISLSAPGMTFSSPSLSPGLLTFSILSNATPNSDQTITLSGLSLNAVGPVGSVIDLTFAATGRTTTYINGLATSTGDFSVATTQSVVQSLTIVPAPGALFGMACLGFATARRNRPR